MNYPYNDKHQDLSNLSPGNFFKGLFGYYIHIFRLRYFVELLL